MEEKKLSTFFAQNRAEQLPDDLWGKYVLPLNYNSYNLLHRTKATHIIGGRGSGKTMYLKYHCYPTILSQKREIVKKDNLKRIGIYWKPDTDFLKLIHEGYLKEQWIGVFNTYVGLSLFIEFSKFVQSFIASNYESDIAKKELEQAVVSNFTFLKTSEPIKIIHLEERCDFFRSELNDWLNYPIGEPPVHFAAKDKILHFIKYVLQKFECLEETSFHIFIDEFENLREEQQAIINSWMKHAVDPLIFNVAYKKHYKPTVSTTGQEKVTLVHDYEQIDIESQVHGDYMVLAAEIIISKIQNFYKEYVGDFPNVIEFNLSNTANLNQRNRPDYKRQIIKNIQKILPTYSFKNLAKITLDNKAIVSKLRRMINAQLKGTEYTASHFIDIERPIGSIVNGVLLNRQTYANDPKALKEMFDSLDNQQYKELTNNSFLGAVLYLYGSFTNEVCPYYGGFNRFTLMSKNNVRHLLELCHKSFIEYESVKSDLPSFEDLFIPTEIQAVAAKKISQNELESKVPDLSDFGYQIKGIVERLGDLYKLAQKQKSQSEPEKNHFSVIGCNLYASPNKMIKTLLDEAKMWSVLLEKKNTKLKDPTDKAYYEYHLHPIFAPYFGISPRQKRKFEFTYEEIVILFTDPINSDSEHEFTKLYQKYSSRFDEVTDRKVNKKAIEPNLLDLL